jgi:hypothetical protein
MQYCVERYDQFEDKYIQVAQYLRRGISYKQNPRCYRGVFDCYSFETDYHDSLTLSLSFGSCHDSAIRREVASASNCYATWL